MFTLTVIHLNTQKITGRQKCFILLHVCSSASIFHFKVFRYRFLIYRQGQNRLLSISYYKSSDLRIVTYDTSLPNLLNVAGKNIAKRKVSTRSKQSALMGKTQRATQESFIFILCGNNKFKICCNTYSRLHHAPNVWKLSHIFRAADVQKHDC